MATSPTERDEHMNELYCALGRFVAQFSLVGASMVQAMVPPEQRSLQVALDLMEMRTSDLIHRWHDAMAKDANATLDDRRALAVIQDEATRLSRLRNELLHSWWAEYTGTKGGLMFYSLKTFPYARWPSTEALASYTQQAAVLADAITHQCGLLRTAPESRKALRLQLAITGKGPKRVVWARRDGDWYSSDGRQQNERPL